MMNTHHPATRIVAALVVSIFLGISTHAQTQNPPFPTGHITVSPAPDAASGSQAHLAWSTNLPANASTGDYNYFIKQVQLPAFDTYITSVNSSGEMISPLGLGSVGSKFEIWAVGGSPLADYLLDTTVIGPYLPTAAVTIHTEDPYPVLPRTRADRPFSVDIAVQEILNGQNDPDLSKGVTLTRYVQSYSATGTGAHLHRDEATLLSQSSVTTNGTQTLSYTINAIPGANRAKVRGEERFSVYSRVDYQNPENIISSKFIQIWPVADGTITGIAQGQGIGAAIPLITFHLNDLYPSSTTYAQVYKGSPQLGTTGTIIPDSCITVNDSIPANRILTIGNYGSVFDSDGLWTMELLTQTPFGTDRLAHVSFTVQGGLITLEEWRETYLGKDANIGDGADLSDFDKDGIANMFEFAFGLDPRKNSAGCLPVPQNSGSNRVIKFIQPSRISGITYGAEWSTTLLPGSWVPIPDTADPPQHSFSVPIATAPNLYLRLKVTGQ